MKLDVSIMKYMSQDEFRTLTAIEQGMKNHEMVPTSLIISIAKLKHGCAKKAITILHKNKLIWHDSKNYDGYKLTYAGYDILAIHAMCLRGSIYSVGNKLGVGKESDIYIVKDENENEIVLKLHRLGRISFRNIKNKRDYLQHRKSASWIYLSRLAALKEFAFMKALYEHNFPVPIPIDQNRHCILMSLIDGCLLAQVKKLQNPGKVYSDCMNLIIRLAQYGLIHCDFNEFNILINDNEKITLIDFPQMISTSHKNAELYFNRDVDCIKTFFNKKFGFIADRWPLLHIDVSEKLYNLDIEVAASGFTEKEAKDFEQLNDALNHEKNKNEISEENRENIGNRENDNENYESENNKNDNEENDNENEENDNEDYENDNDDYENDNDDYENNNENYENDNDEHNNDDYENDNDKHNNDDYENDNEKDSENNNDNIIKNECDDNNKIGEINRKEIRKRIKKNLNKKNIKIKRNVIKNKNRRDNQRFIQMIM